MLSMVTVLYFILSVVLSLTQIAASDDLTSLEVCHQIRDDRIKILAMGSRGYRDVADKHWVYLLAEGGYLFVVPFKNLTVDPRQAKKNKLTIGGDYINASKLFNVKAENFTVKASGQSRYQRYSFISDDHGQHYLMRLYGPSNDQDVCIEHYHLANGTKKSLPSSCHKYEHFTTQAHFLLSLDSTDKSPNHPDQGLRIEAWAYEVRKDDMRLAYVFRAEHHDQIKLNRLPDDKPQNGSLSPLQAKITSAFGLILNNSATLVLLTDTGKVIVAERKHLNVKDVPFVSSVRQPLNEFIECVVSDANTGWGFYFESFIKIFDNWWTHYKWWIVLAASGTVLIVLICAWALCRCFKKKKNRETSTDREAGTDQEASKEKHHKKRDEKRRHKKKRHNKNSPTTTNGANTSGIDTSSGPTSDIHTTINIESIANRMKSMLTQSAKSTNKAKKGKVAVSKKSKKSKADKKPSKDA